MTEKTYIARYVEQTGGKAGTLHLKAKNQADAVQEAVDFVQQSYESTVATVELDNGQHRWIGKSAKYRAPFTYLPYGL